MMKLKNWQWVAIIIVAIFVITQLPGGFLGSITGYPVVPDGQGDNFKLSSMTSSIPYPTMMAGSATKVTVNVKNDGGPAGSDNAMMVECGFYEASTPWLTMSVIGGTLAPNCVSGQTSVVNSRVSVPAGSSKIVSMDVKVPTSFSSNYYVLWCEAFENCYADSPYVLKSSYVMSPEFKIIGASTGVSCTNQIKDGLETDVDCGGTTCLKCMYLAKCKVDSDCASNRICTNDKTKIASTDLFQNDGLRCYNPAPTTPEDPEETIKCSTAADPVCDDKDATTTDKCNLPGTTSSYCTNTPAGCTPCTKAAQEQDPKTCVCTDLGGGATGECSTDAGCVGKVSSLGVPISFCQISATTNVGSCAASPFQMYKRADAAFWGKSVVSGTSPEFKFGIKNVDPATSSTNVEMLYISASSPLGKTIEVAAGSANIFSILGFGDELALTSRCQPSEDFGVSAKLSNIPSKQDGTYALNPKVPSSSSKFADGTSNWASDGVYWLVIGTYQKCGDSWGQILTTKVNVVQSECSSDSSCSSAKPYCRFGLCRTESDVKRTLTGESLGDGCLLGEGGTYVNCAGGGSENCVSSIKDSELAYTSSTELKNHLCGEIRYNQLGPELQEKYSSFWTTISEGKVVKLECCGTARCTALDTLPKSVQDRVSEWWSIDKNKGLCMEETPSTDYWGKAKEAYEKFKFWVWAVVIIFIIIVVGKVLLVGPAIPKIPTMRSLFR